MNGPVLNKKSDDVQIIALLLFTPSKQFDPQLMAEECVQV